MDIYKCNVCGNIVELLHSGGGQLVCCGQPMDKLEAKTDDVGKEKHVPVIEKTENGVTVKVGAVPHPMEEAHHIEWVDLLADDMAYRIFLKPHNDPKAAFKIEADKFGARAYCNVHGLWRS